MKYLIPLMGLLAACISIGGGGSRDVVVTHSIQGGSIQMTRSSGVVGGGRFPDVEFRVKGGILLVREGDSGVQLDLSDFPGDSITRYFDSLDPPLVFDLPDGTRFVFHGSSFEVGDETYEIEPGSGVVSYVHPGELVTD